MLFFFDDLGLFYLLVSFQTRRNRAQRFRVTFKLHKWHWSSALGEREDVRWLFTGKERQEQKKSILPGNGNADPVDSGRLESHCRTPAVRSSSPLWTPFKRKTLLLLGSMCWTECPWQCRARSEHSAGHVHNAICSLRGRQTELGCHWALTFPPPPKYNHPGGRRR